MDTAMEQHTGRREFLTAATGAVAGLTLGPFGSGGQIQAALVTQPRGQSHTTLDIDLLHRLEQVRAAGLATSRKVQKLEPQMAPFRRDEESWRNTLDRFRQLYASTPTGQVLGAPVRLDAPSLHATASAAPAQSQGQAPYEFRLFDRLLDEAADLLDRALRDRSEWDSLATKAFASALEIEEYAELDKIHQDETRAGYYTVLYSISEAEAAAEIARIGTSQRVLNALRALLQARYTDSALRELVGLAEFGAFVSGLPTYQQERDGKTPISFTRAGTGGERPDWLARAAQAQTASVVATQAAILTTQQISEEGAEAAAQRRAQAMVKKAEYDRLDMDFRRRRTEVARRLADRRVEAATASGGVLNYAERMRPLKERFEADAANAYQRLQYASEGLQKLFGYGVPLPAGPSSSLFDECVRWTRQAIDYVLRTSQRDLSTVEVLSVRTLAGDAAWKKGLASGRWSFALTASALSGLCGVRLRGISAAVVHERDAKDLDGSWRVEVIPPTQTMNVHATGTQVTYEQRLSPVRLTRVTRRSHVRDPQVGGLQGVYNASPAGEWHIRLADRSSGGDPRDRVRDLEIELFLAYQEVP
jgi:hypothetical protein